MSKRIVECKYCGIDIGKSLFHVVGCDDSGRPVWRKKFNRAQLLEYFVQAKHTVIGMEACPGSQWLARKLIKQGHDAKIMSAQFVKPYLKRQKNDTNDAEAIAEAVQRPTMRFVGVKTTDQSDIQALHRVRDRLVKQQTQIINQARALGLECGITLPSGVATFFRDFPRVLEDADNELSPRMRRILHGLWEDVRTANSRLQELTSEIKAIASHDELARRLMTIPGIGELGATALVAAVADPRDFRKGRDLAAWIGLVPRQYTTGGNPRLLGISKQGNPYLRRLLIHGARSAKRHLNRQRDTLGPWLDKAEERMHPNKVVVALANKIARIAWVIMTQPGTTYDKGEPALG